MSRTRDSTLNEIVQLVDENTKLKDFLIKKRIYRKFINDVHYEYFTKHISFRYKNREHLSKTLKMDKLSDVMLNSMFWSKTKEGHSYWFNIYKRIKTLEINQ